MRVAVLSHAPPATGTYTSSHRIAGHIAAGGHEVEVVEHWDPEVAEAATHPGIHAADLLIGTHAVQSGRVFLETSTPFILVISGTDLNVAAECAVADEAIAAAAQIVAYDEHHLERACERWPNARAKLRLIRKGVATQPSSFSLRKRLDVAESTTMCLLPSGLRAVKDVLFVIDEFASVDSPESKRLVIAGLPREPDYVELVHRRCSGIATVDVIPPLRSPDLHAAMREADLVLNTSLSESSPNALLEAMHVGACVVARDIPGNRSVVVDGVTGRLFRSPDEFGEIVSSLDESISERLRSAAMAHVTRHHGLDREQAEYLTLVEEVTA